MAVPVKPMLEAEKPYVKKGVIVVGEVIEAIVLNIG